MAKKQEKMGAKPQAGMSGGVLNGGWAGSVLKTLVSVFVIAIIFGVFLDATVVTNSAISTSQPYSVASTTTQNSINAIHFAAANTVKSLTVVYSGDWFNISSANPLTLSLTGNAVTTFGTNQIATASNAQQTKVYTITNPNAVILESGSIFFNINSVSLSVPNGAYYVGTLGATVTQSFNAVANGDVTNTYETNTINGVGQLTSAAQTIAGSSPTSVYQSIVEYLVTLANFVGIIILLVIIMIVILVIYALFAPIGGGMGGGTIGTV